MCNYLLLFNDMLIVFYSHISTFSVGDLRLNVLVEFSRSNSFKAVGFKSPIVTQFIAINIESVLLMYLLANDPWIYLPWEYRDQKQPMLIPKI